MGYWKNFLIEQQEESVRLLEDIYQRVTDYCTVTFAELQRLQGFEGNRTLYLDPGCSVIGWTEVSDDAQDALKELLLAERIVIVPSDPMAYLYDGEALAPSVAEEVRKHDEPHWYPVAVCDAEWVKEMDNRTGGRSPETRVRLFDFYQRLTSEFGANAGSALW